MIIFGGIYKTSKLDQNLYPVYFLKLEKKLKIGGRDFSFSLCQKMLRSMTTFAKIQWEHQSQVVYVKGLWHSW